VIRSVLLGLFLALAGLPLPAQEAQPPLPVLDFLIGKDRVSAEVARTPGQMERGLMFRMKMADDAGMIFVLGAPQRAQFWMENTFLPLSVAYLDAQGKIVEIHDMKPFDRTVVASESREICYALEMNQGWFAARGIAAGTPLRPVAPGAAFGKPPLSPPTP